MASSQLVFEKTQKWPFDQWAHGKPGLIQAYGELLGANGEDQVKKFLKHLLGRRIKGHWPCPCGNGSKYRNCHRDHLDALYDRIPKDIARRALDRLNLLP